MGGDDGGGEGGGDGWSGSRRKEEDILVMPVSSLSLSQQRKEKDECG